MHVLPKALLSALLMLLVALSGCFGGGDDADAAGDDPGDDDSGDGGGDSTGDSTGDGPGDDDPGDDGGDDGSDGGTQTITLAVDLRADPASGGSPLNVSFTVDADPRDANTTWSLTFGDGAEDASGNGSALPADIVHTFAAEGNYTATLTASHPGALNTATANVTIQVTAPAGDGNETSGPENVDITFAGTMTAFAPAGLTGVGAQQDFDEFCAYIDHAKTGGDDAQGVYIEWFDVEVQEGAKKAYIEGGAEVLGEDPLLGIQFPDFDVMIQDANGDCHVGGTEGAYEHLNLPDPPVGATTMAILYWAGPPAADYTGFLQVLY